MSTSADPRVARLHELLSALTERRFVESLEQVEAVMASWRRGEVEPLVVHEATVRHIERADGIMREAMRIARAPAELVAASVAAGLLDDAERAELEREPLPDLAAEVRLPPSPRPDKRAVADKLLSEGPILAHADARRPGVSVPARFAGEAKLVLRFGYGLSPPIPDLTVDEQGIAGTLVFGGVPFLCVLPWTAIFALVVDGGGRGMVWPEDAPDELVVAGAGDKGAADKGAADPGGKPDDDPDPGPARRPSHLRLVD
jgi:stringent starvation protein B